MSRLRSGEVRMCTRKVSRILIIALICVCASIAARASVYSGQVNFGGLPVPGATVTALQGDKTISVTTDESGVFRFADLLDGDWKIEVKMLCFEIIKADVTIAPQMSPAKWELKLLPIAELKALATPIPQVTAPTAPVLAASAEKKPDVPGAQQGPAEIPKPASEADQDSNDGFLVNGSVNNAATSQFSLDRAFGNRRFNTFKVYNGGFRFTFDNSALDARQYSLSGFSTPKPGYDRFTAGFEFGGPLRIPHLLPRKGPNFFVGYQWTRNNTTLTQSALVPTLDERAGNRCRCAGAACHDHRSKHGAAIREQSGAGQSAGSGSAQFISTAERHRQSAV